MNRHNVKICENHIRETSNDGVHKFFKIRSNDKIIGKYGLSFYDDVKAVGIGSLEIFPEYRGSGYGTKTIKRIVERYKEDYDLIYCFVDADNYNAIKLYDKIGKVYFEDGVNDLNQYYVEFYNCRSEQK